jgi:hypothetical protein
VIVFPALYVSVISDEGIDPLKTQLITMNRDVGEVKMLNSGELKKKMQKETNMPQFRPHNKASEIEPMELL